MSRRPVETADGHSRGAALPAGQSWRDLAALLSTRTTPLKVYFRDDDAGWDDASLLRLLETFARHGIALDLAVIPQALSTSLAHQLRSAMSRQSLGLHQHGYAHGNHESTGRKCEFGPSRSEAEQAADIRAGAFLLEHRLGDQIQPIFTPPWNRCTQTTANTLSRLGFRALSRDAGATPLPVSGLLSLPVHLDWQQRGRAGEALAAVLERGATLGVMLHHAVMDSDDHSELETLLRTLRAMACVQFVGMSDLLAQ